MNPQQRVRSYPNVKARLHCSINGPGVSPREYTLDIWMKDSRFHVRDEAGRDVASILEDLAAPRGLGRPVRTIEEMMDLSRVHESRADRMTEIYADLSSEHGWVYRWQQPRWALPSQQLAPAAQQILIDTVDSRLQRIGQVTLLNRQCTEYRGAVDVAADGLDHKSEVTLVVCPPFVLLNHTCDALDRSWFMRREVTQLDEGVVIDDDVVPPS